VVECSYLLFSLHLEGHQALYTNTNTSVFLLPSVALVCSGSRPDQDGNVASLRLLVGMERHGIGEMPMGRTWDGIGRFTDRYGECITVVSTSN